MFLLNFYFHPTNFVQEPKYYEYFLKEDFQDKENEDEFYNFYLIIINAFNLENDEHIKKDINTFFKLYDSISTFGRRNYKFLEYDDIKKIITESGASFDAFTPTKYMVKYEDFLFSTGSGRNNHNRGENFCKAYISIKPEKYVETLIKIQSFIDTLYRERFREKIGECKFRDCPANDAIVMRFACEEHYNEFLKFLDQNQEIKEAYDKPNPFIPQDSYGLSIIPDEGGSYNYFVARIIWDYMFYCRENSISLSVSSLTDFISLYDCSKERKLRSYSKEIIDDYKTILIKKLSKKLDDEILSIVFKKNQKINTKK